MNRFLTLALGVCLLAAPAAAGAQDEPDDAALKLAEPDFTLIGLPTGLRLPRFGSAFRVTHRFNQPLNEDFGDFAGDFFGIDSGAQIGLEYRFGLFRNAQIGIHRTSNKTIEFFGVYGALRQGGSMPLDVSALVAIDGTNNFRDSYSPSLGAIVSRKFGNAFALYVEPIWVNNTNPLPKEVSDHNDTFIVGIGGRVRVLETVYLVAEAAPRSAYKPERSVTHASFAIEKRVGGHVFQLNFSNAFGTEFSQIARGGPSGQIGEGDAKSDWYMGFNISRKFF